MLKEINVHAGAVDVGSESFAVAVYGGGARIFGTFTCDLQRVLEFFKDNGIKTVAMEATDDHAVTQPAALSCGAEPGCQPARPAFLDPVLRSGWH